MLPRGFGEEVVKAAVDAVHATLTGRRLSTALISSYSFVACRSADFKR